MTLPLSRLVLSMVFAGLTLSVGCGSSGTQSGGRRTPAAEQKPAKGLNKDKSKDKQKDDDNIDVDLPGDDEDGDDLDGGRDDQANGDDRCYKGDAVVCAAEYKVFELTNQVRAGRGLAPFKFSKNASFVARGWSKSQANGGFISHDGFPSARQADYQREFGTRFDSTAENVAMTGGAQDPATDFIEMWVGSFGHLQNILGDHESLGVGIAQTSDGSWYATQLFGAE